ncbi:hypothetical protein Dimus_037852 [Dionaea muscipula]
MEDLQAPQAATKGLQSKPSKNPSSHQGKHEGTPRNHHLLPSLLFSSSLSLPLAFLYSSSLFPMNHTAKSTRERQKNGLPLCPPISMQQHTSPPSHSTPSS